MGTRRLSSTHGEFTLFFTKSSPFSNFYPCTFEADALDGKRAYWNCVEHYYMYNKAISFGSREAADAIFPLNDPKRMKIIGSELIDKEKCAKWNEISGDVMKKALTAKYMQNEDLRYYLFMTYGSRLVECSPMDRTWGIGITIENALATNPLRWRGENRLGKIMDEVRDELWDIKDYCEQRTQVVDGLAIPGFAVAYFQAKFPFSAGSGTPESRFTSDRKSLGSSARRSINRENTTRGDDESSRKRNRERRRSRSTPTPVFRRRRSSTPRRRSPVKKRGRRDSSTSSTSSASTFGRYPTPERKRRSDHQMKSCSPMTETKCQEYEPAATTVQKNADDMLNEFLQEHVLNKDDMARKKKKDDETNRQAQFENKVPGKYAASPKFKRSMMDNLSNSNVGLVGKVRGRSQERKKNKEKRRKSKSRSKSRERKHKKKSRSHSRSRGHHSKEKNFSSRGDESLHNKNTPCNSDKKKREHSKKDGKAIAKQSPGSVQKKEKSEDEKRRDSTMQKLMSGLLNKKKNDTMQEHQYYYQQF